MVNTTYICLFVDAYYNNITHLGLCQLVLKSLDLDDIAGAQFYCLQTLASGNKCIEVRKNMMTMLVSPSLCCNTISYCMRMHINCVVVH